MALDDGLAAEPEPQPGERRDQRERRRERPGILAHLPDELGVDLAEEAAGVEEIVDALRVDPHEVRRRAVDGHRIGPDDDHARVDRVALDRSVALHAHDAVDDREAGTHRRGDVEDRAVSPAQWRTFFGQP